jgi:putative ABC transport system substrate-binding protein
MRIPLATTRGKVLSVRRGGSTIHVRQIRVDIIFTAWGTLTALASKRATSTVPIIFACVGDAVGVGLVPSLAHPGGNLTGSTFITEETIGKQLQLLKEVVPGVSRIGVVINPSNPVYGPILRASEAPARVLGLELSVVGVERSEDFESAFRKAIQTRADGLVVLRDALLQINQTRILMLAADSRLPAVYGMREFSGKRRPDVVWAEPRRNVPSGCVLGRKDIQRRKPR